MSSRWVYMLAVIFLLIIRVGIINLRYDEWLLALHYDNTAHFINALRNSPPFINYIGSWALPVYVVSVLVFWMTEDDNADIPKQFLLLPIVYVPFSIIGTILSTAEFQVSYLYVQPLVILPFGYLYVSVWTIFIWLLDKIGVVR